MCYVPSLKATKEISALLWPFIDEEEYSQSFSSTSEGLEPVSIEETSGTGIVSENDQNETPPVEAPSTDSSVPVSQSENICSASTLPGHLSDFIKRLEKEFGPLQQLVGQVIDAVLRQKDCQQVYQIVRN